MEDKQILDRINKENKTYLPDVRDRVVSRAKAEGLLEMEDGDGEEEYHYGSVAALGKKGIRAIAITVCAAIAFLCLVIALPIALSPKDNGTLDVPPVVDPNNPSGNPPVNPPSDITGDNFNPPVLEELGLDYGVGLVGTAKLMEPYAVSARSARAAASRTAESGIDNFGIYFSAFDDFFSKDMMQTRTLPYDGDYYNKTATISGVHANGAAADFEMRYLEALDLNTSTAGRYDYYLEGVITLGYYQFYMTGRRTVTVSGGAQAQTALEVRAYPSKENQNTYAKMELTDAGYKFTVVEGGATKSEALMYRSADLPNAAYVVETEGEGGGTFTVAYPSAGRGEVSVDYVYGEENAQFIVNTAENELEFVLCDYLVYQASGDGSYWTATGVNRSNLPADGKVVIPTYVGGKPVKSVGTGAFANQSAITSAVIPDSVESLRDSAFSGCSYLTEVILPAGLTYLPSYAFYRCVNLESISIPDTVQSIGADAFYTDAKLKQFNFPASLKTISSGAFYGCAGYENLFIPESVQSIGETAFSDWPNLKTVSVAPANDNFNDTGNCLVDKYGVLIVGCVNSTIPNDGSVRIIGRCSFANCAITNVTIPSSVITINSSAFYNSGITSAIIPSSVDVIDNMAFYGCKNLTSITLPDKKIEIRAEVFYNSAYYNDNANWDNNVLYIGKHLIRTKQSIYQPDSAFTLREGTLTTAYGAIDLCTFKSVVFNSELLYIGSRVLNNGTSVDEITMNGENARYKVVANCLIDTETETLIAGGRNAVIPDDGSVRTIASGAFNGYNSQNNNGTFYIPWTVGNIESEAITGNGFDTIIIDGARIESYAIRCDATEIIVGGMADECAFSGCFNLRTVRLNNRCLSYNMFEYCENIETVYCNFSKEIWLQEIERVPQWYDKTAEFTVICNDGTKFDKWGNIIQG